MKQYLVFAFLFFMLLNVAAAGAAENIPGHDLRVWFDLDQKRLVGKSQITLPPDREWVIHVGGLKLIAAAALGGPTSFRSEGAAIIVPAAGTANTLTIEYEAAYPTPVMRGREDGIETANIIGNGGIALMNAWYPGFEGLAKYRLTAVLPAGFEAVSEADGIEIRTLPDMTREFTFVFDHPLEGINLVAGRYIRETWMHRAVELNTYFFPEEKELAGTYLEQTRRYLDMYEDLVGPFPFKRFSVVENILPTGYSMPTFTLLGRDVVKLPFIVETSLGHEILHQWFGNSVYADYAKGNWTEGLTTYLSDHLYEEKKGRGWEYRKQALTSYQSYVTEENDFALKEFTARSDKATASVGYGKTAMVFHMLKQMLGKDVFSRALKEFYAANRFRRASWADLQAAFEAASSKKLDVFFRQWIDGKGAISFDISSVMVKFEGSNARVSFDVVQKGRQDRFLLPVRLKADSGDLLRTFEIENEKSSIEITVAGVPVELVLDGNYDLFRRMAEDETAPVISMLLGDRNRIFAVPKDRDYPETSSLLKEEGFLDKKEEDLKYEDLKASSLLVFADTPFAKRLFANSDMPEGEFSLIIKQNPYSKKSVIGIMSGSSADAVTGYLRRMAHYGKYSVLAFKDGRNTVKSVAQSDQGIRIPLKSETVGIEIPRITTAGQIIDTLSNKKIIYVGEHHDRFDHHRVQLQVIRELYKKGGNIAIGMEMFQKPFQPVLDDYIAGRIEEREFLKKSEYYKRWSFDYNLYREILLFARENRIPVIALNIRKEIVNRVAKEGLQALSEAELKEVPDQLDLSDTEYRDRLRGFFGQHASSESRNFDFFYQSQVLWDESMAHNLDEFMQKNPGLRVVVLAGVGHMSFGSGIPKRAHRLNRKDYTVILNSADVEKDVADYLLYPDTLPYTESPKLGIMLKEEGGRVSVAGFSPHSASEQAGLKVDDLILSLDGQKTETVDDIKIHLLYKKKGDTVAVKVQRKRFLFGEKDMEISLTL